MNHEQTAFRAKRDLNQGRYCKDFTWPVVIGHNNTQLRNVTRRGMAENHFHLWGSAPYFHISWIWIMNHVEECERSDAFKWVGDNARVSYIYPILWRFGLIEVPEAIEKKMGKQR